MEIDVSMDFVFDLCDLLPWLLTPTCVELWIRIDLELSIPIFHDGHHVKATGVDDLLIPHGVSIYFDRVFDPKIKFSIYFSSFMTQNYE